MSPLALVCAASWLIAAEPAAAEPAAAAQIPSSDNAPCPSEAQHLYRWPRQAQTYLSLAAEIAPPPDHARLPAARGSYAYWLRHLPLRHAGTPVRSYDGRLILPADHQALVRVVDLDLSRRDRQQCVDTIIRLRGEYLLASGRAQEARFLWAGGIRFPYAAWVRGQRPKKEGRRWTLQRSARPQAASYRSFRAYLEYLFSWTGTVHHLGERRVKRQELAAGDFFIQAGSPGHAVVILDLARSAQGELRGLIAQGFMPAQDLHLLRGSDGSPWFKLDPAQQTVVTPLWAPFRWQDLRRFRH